MRIYPRGSQLRDGKGRVIFLYIKSQITSRGPGYKVPAIAYPASPFTQRRWHLSRRKIAVQHFPAGLRQIILSSALLTLNDDPDAPYFIVSVRRSRCDVAQQHTRASSGPHFRRACIAQGCRDACSTRSTYRATGENPLMGIKSS